MSEPPSKAKLRLPCSANRMRNVAAVVAGRSACLSDSIVTRNASSLIAKSKRPIGSSSRRAPKAIMRRPMPVSAGDVRVGLLDRLARCFRDYRNSHSVEHGAGALPTQRVYALALGYEDVNDHGELRRDSLLALLLSKADLKGVKCASPRPGWFLSRPERLD